MFPTILTFFLRSLRRSQGASECPIKSLDGAAETDEEERKRKDEKDGFEETFLCFSHNMCIMTSADNYL